MPGAAIVETAEVEPSTQIATDPHDFIQAVDKLQFFPVFEPLLFLRTTIKDATHQIDVNRWDFTVDTDLKKLEVEKNKSMLIDAIRELTKNPTIILRIHVDPSIASNANSGAYLTRDEKKSAMEAANPAFLELQKRFNTYMI
jgi:hypothetical protein